jgi:DNA repair exonuclease SbcCD nuclease subunit
MAGHPIRRDFMFKFVHAADLHIDSPLRGLERYPGAPAEEIRGATRRALENLVRLACDEKAAFVLLAGDLFDGDWRDFNTGLFFADQMRRLREAGIRVFAVSGNHDAQSRITRSLRMPDNVRILSSGSHETVVLDDVGVAIHGRSFPRAAVTENYAVGYPDALPDHFNIGLLHTSLDGRPGHEPYAPCSLNDLAARRYDYWALGHVHEREVPCQDPWIVFPGNTQGRHARECGPKGCTVVTVEDGECLCVEHRDLHTVEWVQCEVEAAGAGPEETVDRVRETLASRLDQTEAGLLAARIVVRGTTQAHGAFAREPQKWTNEIRTAATDAGSGRVWLEKIAFDTRAAASLDEVIARGGAVAEILESLGQISADDPAMAALNTDLGNFLSRLPSGIEIDSDAARRIERGRDLLIARIVEGGDNA